MSFLNSPLGLAVVASMIVGGSIAVGIIAAGLHLGKILLRLQKPLQELVIATREPRGEKVERIRDGLQREISEAFDGAQGLVNKLGSQVRRDMNALQQDVDGLRQGIANLTELPAYADQDPTWTVPAATESAAVVNEPSVDPNRTGAIATGAYNWDPQEGEHQPLPFAPANEDETRRYLLSFVTPTFGPPVMLWEAFPELIRGEQYTNYQVALSKLSAQMGFDVVEAGLLDADIMRQFPSLAANPAYLEWRRRQQNS